MDLAHLQMESNDENHGQQCTGLAELSFRIESPGELSSKLRILDASMSSLLEKRTDDQADFAAISSAGGGESDMLVLQCKKSEMPSKENIPAVNSTLFSHIDEGIDRVLNNGEAVSSDLVVYTPNHNNNAVGREARGMSYADADCIDGKVMKIGGILLRKASFPMPSSRPKISSLLKRDYQSQVFSRSNYESAKAGCKDKCGIELERAITYPKASQVEKACPVSTQEREEAVDDEDLYRPPGIHSNQTHNIKTPFYLSDHQKVPCLEEELYPVLVDDKLALGGQGFEGSSFPSQNDLYSHGGKEHFPQVSSSHLSSAKEDNLYSSNAGAEGYLVDQFDHPSACFAEPHEHSHTRFQNFRCHPNKQYALDLFCSRLPSGNRACALPMASHQFTGPSFASQKDISPPVPLNYAPHADTYYNEHACMQSTSHMPTSAKLHFCAPTCAQHSARSYQPWHAEDRCLQCTAYERCSINLPQRGLHNKQQIHGGAGLVLQTQSHACLARKENCPPLPGFGAPPYVLCQGCHKILQVPDLRKRSVLQRIRCGACGRISKFCNVLHTQYQTLLEDGFKHRSHALPTRMGPSEQGLAHDVNKVHMPTELDRNLRSSYGYSGQCNRVDKYLYSQGNGTPVSSYDMEKLDSFYHPRLPATMSMEQRPCESEWRYGTNYGLAGSSGKARENHFPFTVNGSGVLRNTAAYPSYKMQQLNGRVNSVSQYAELGQGKEAFKTPRFADNFIQEQRDSRVRVSSGEIQGLSLGCPQEGSRDGSSLIRHVDRRNLQQGHGNVVVKNGLNGASCAPAPGSPLHKHLSYDTASDFVEWAHKHGEKGKQTDAELSAQEVSKGSRFLSGLLKKNISEFGRGPGSNKNWKVVINGQMLPYAAVKSAEKQAGTIRPGVYWYDYQAGFWGVMGGPCLGIIPPYIAEFNFPLAKECAGGTTGVFVNGRELHKKDLDVLSGRGLPRTCGKAYMVDISGQVIDQMSGQVLRSLGRLAPTIERRGRGCGMFQPPTQS